MPGPITRKIELMRQIEEAERSVRELRSAGGRRDGLAEERLLRREAIVTTLRWNLDNEHLIREWAASRNTPRGESGTAREAPGGQPLPGNGDIGGLQQGAQPAPPPSQPGAAPSTASRSPSPVNGGGS